MIRYQSQQQIPLAEFDWPFQVALDENNRWVKMSDCIPWDELAEGYYQGFSSSHGRPLKDARLAIGAVIIKHKLCLSDRETVAQIQENPYLQYFVGLPGYQMAAPFAPSLLVEIRKRMGPSVFEAFHGAIIDAVEKARTKNRQSRSGQCKSRSDDDPEPPSAPETTEQEPAHPPCVRIVVGVPRRRSGRKPRSRVALAMRVGPSVSPIRRRYQTARSCIRQERLW